MTSTLFTQEAEQDCLTDQALADVGRPIAHLPPSEVCINPVPEDADQATLEKGVNFPTLKRAIEKIR